MRGSHVLQQPVLVLNRSLLPLQQATVEYALIAVAGGKALVVNHADPEDYSKYTWDDWTALRPAEDDLVVRTPSLEIIAPQIIALCEYNSYPNRGVTCSRINIWKRDRYQCQYCGKRPPSKDLTLDHVMPRAQGGIFSWENIVLACFTCNQKKAGRTPRQAGMKLIRQPVKPEWRPFYADPARACKSWSKFVSDVYWRVPLEQG